MKNFFLGETPKIFKNKIQIFVNNLILLIKLLINIFYKILKKNNILTPKTYLGEVKIQIYYKTAV